MGQVVEVRSRHRVWLAVLAVLLLGWSAGLIGWWLSPDGRGSGASPSAAVSLNPAEREEYSDGAGPAPSTIGVLFNDDHRCTATLISSNSGSVAVTAAHCVYTDGRWGEGLAFAPGYSNGNPRFGTWPVEQAWVPAAWQEGSGRAGNGELIYPEHDVAFLRLARDPDGNTAQDVLGAQGFTFDSPDQQQVTITGYPAAPPYDGESQQSCTGTARNTGSLHGAVVQLDCTLTGGSSGSAWMTDLDPTTGLGFVTAVESVGGDSSVSGPPLGVEAERLYRAADRT